MKGNTAASTLAPDDARRLLLSPPVRRLPGRNWSKADLLVYRSGERLLAVKDYSGRAFVVRQTLGRWLVRRETAAFHAAAGVPGLPRFLGRVGPFALATEWIDAQPLAGVEPARLGGAWQEELAAILAALHERGVALGDLHHRDVLVGADGTVHVVDLATAWVLGVRPGPLRRYVFERLRDQDRVAFARMRARFAGQDVEAAVREVGAAAAAWHRRGRRVKRWIDRLRGGRGTR